MSGTVAVVSRSAALSASFGLLVAGRPVGLFSV